MGGAGDGLPVITKAGAFGEPDTLLQLYGLLAQRTQLTKKVY
jgi:uncharacterized protein YgbK (DUF1537 family)